MRTAPAGGVFIGYKMMTIFDNKLQNEYLYSRIPKNEYLYKPAVKAKFF